MNSFPVRLVHSVVSGLFAGLILMLVFFHIQGRFLRQPPAPVRIVDVEPTQLPNPAPTPVATDPPVNPDDAIPKTWEIQFHHDPAANDAGADFDNDGLTALQEYELYQRTGGVSGNPLGIWATETLQPPAELGVQYLYPQDINRHGEILLNADFNTDGQAHFGSIFVDSDRNWILIRQPDSFPPDFIWCTDLNDMGVVAGGWSSFDWGDYDGFLWSAIDGYQAVSLRAARGFPTKINNHGDWVGSLQDTSGNWQPAYVINGVNMHSDRDWWPAVWYQDINDFGEALGTYYSANYQSTHAFLAYGPWLYDTGLNSTEPEFDPNTNSYMNSVALNSRGEFSSGSSGSFNGTWTYPGYIFDGEFKEIQSSRFELNGLSPSSISDDKTVTANGNSIIHRDGVTILISEICPSANGYYTIISNGNDRRILASSADGQSIIVITPDQDQDGDGISDDWEDYYGSNKNSAADANADPDGDGTNNLGEFLLRTDPNISPAPGPEGQTIDLRPGIDTDGDGIPNTWEWQHGLAFDDAADAPRDYDRDGYTNLQEYHLNTDPRGAPSYRMRVLGPFPGASSADLSSAVLGDGHLSGNTGNIFGANIQETAYFNASPDTTANGGYRPAAWSVLRGDDSGSFSFASSHGNAHSYSVVHSPLGASLCHIYSNPKQFVYWASPAAQPVTLSGHANQYDIANLSYVRISPLGNYVTGIRQTASTSSYQPVVWKMPTSPTSTFKPIHLIPPSGVTLPSWGTYFINDYGYVLANGTVSGQSRPILWKVSADGLTVTSSILLPLHGSNWANATGISNQDPPLICGTSSVSSQNRAVVWTAAGDIANLGTFPGGNFSYASLISRGGSIAGIANVLVGNTLKQQPFLATYVSATSSWKLQPQGQPVTHAPQLASINDSGEILGAIIEHAPSYRQISTIWHHGSSHAVESCLTHAAGANVEYARQLSPRGTIFATVWRDGERLSVLLTPERDTDGDGLPDAYENQLGFNAFVKNSPTSDSDSDNLTDLEEFRNGTDPRHTDTDRDGMPDGWEVSWGLLPLDPSDAALDPDNDRVTNLRESQIGTTPTGIYKVETRFTDTAAAYAHVVAAADDGQVVHTGQTLWNSGMDEYENPWDVTIQTFHALPPVQAGPDSPSVPLPSQSYFQFYDSGANLVGNSEEFTAHRPDASTGTINGEVFRHGYDYTSYGYQQTLFLIPDAANNPDEENWITWADIEANLRDPYLHGGTAPLDEYDVLYPYPDLVSPAGKRRLHRSGYGDCFVINEIGEFIEKLTDNSWWDRMNDEGTAARMASTYVPAANGLPAYYAPQLVLSTGESISLPHDPGVTTNYSVLSYSNDGKVLLMGFVPNTQLGSSIKFFLLDTANGTLEPIRRPGIGYEYITNLSNQNSRLLGSGPKPFQITPDGTCIRLEALRIKNSPAETAVPFGTLYPNPLTPNHIASNGRITLTTTNSNNQQVILQITPHNDTDNDGVPDDWEKNFAEMLLVDYGVQAPTDPNLFDVTEDYGDFGTSSLDVFNNHGDFPEVLLKEVMANSTVVGFQRYAEHVKGGYIAFPALYPPLLFPPETGSPIEFYRKLRTKITADSYYEEPIVQFAFAWDETHETTTWSGTYSLTPLFNLEFLDTVESHDLTSDLTIWTCMDSSIRDWAVFSSGPDSTFSGQYWDTIDVSGVEPPPIGLSYDHANSSSIIWTVDTATQRTAKIEFHKDGFQITKPQPALGYQPHSRRSQKFSVEAELLNPYTTQEMIDDGLRKYAVAESEPSFAAIAGRDVVENETKIRLMGGNYKLQWQIPAYLEPVPPGYPVRARFIWRETWQPEESATNPTEKRVIWRQTQVEGNPGTIVEAPLEELPPPEADGTREIDPVWATGHIEVKNTLLLNSDDDDVNGVEDRLQSSLQPLVENDLIPIRFSARAPSEDEKGMIYKLLATGEGKVRLWEYAQGQSLKLLNLPYQLKSHDLDNSPIPKPSYFIEATEPGNVHLKLSVERLGQNFGNVSEKQLSLISIELATDLNNDGQITSADSFLRKAAANAEASDAAKENGTEYLFINDKMSNGVWDADDHGVLSFSYGVADWAGLGAGYGRMPKPPATHTDDDDAEPIKVQVSALTNGVVWFDHPTIDKLEFFKTRECKASDIINIKYSTPFDLSTGTLPEIIYMRLRDDWAGTDQDGNLRMCVGKNLNEIWAELILPLTVVRDFGAKHFFHAARDYIMENNTRLCIRDHGYPFGSTPSVIFRFCVMREEATRMTTIDSAAENIGGIEASWYDMFWNDHIHPAVVINGNQCFFSSGLGENVADSIQTQGTIADKCHGRVIRGGVTATTSSDNYDPSTKPAKGSDLAGPDPIPAGILPGPDGMVGTSDDIVNPAGIFAGSDGVLGTLDDIANPYDTPGGKYVGWNSGAWTFAAGRAGGSDALGGLSTFYASPNRIDKAHQMIGYAKGLESGKGSIFTATQIKGVGYGPIVKADASIAGVPVLTPSADAEAIKLFILDSGAGSLALMHIDPTGTMRGAYMGRKTNFGYPYYVNNYLALDPVPPRP
jgi:hypothetical protein